jgi:hypothetical protein
MTDSSKRAVVRWVSYVEAEDMKECGVGGLGGWFGGRGKDRHPHRWKDYLDVWEPEVHPYCEALRVEIVRRDIKEGGFWHQGDTECVPVFDDGTVATFSFRAWGDLLAAVWSEADNEDHSYCEFVW